MARLLLVRHARTEWNESGRYQGRTDIDLSAAGRREAEALKRRLASESIQAVYCSDLKRAVQTAETIVSGRSLEPVACEEVREIDFGEFEGLTFQEIRESYPHIDWWGARDADLQLPRGESISQLAARVGRFTRRLKGYPEAETVLIVSHGGTIRALICALLGLGLGHWWQIGLDSASLTVVHTHPGGTLMSLLNDTCHLKHLRKPR